MAEKKPFVFYDDTKRVEEMRTGDTAPSIGGSNIFSPFVQSLDITIPTNNLADFVAEYEISGTVMLSAEGTSILNID